MGRSCVGLEGLMRCVLGILKVTWDDSDNKVNDVEGRRAVARK